MTKRNEELCKEYKVENTWSAIVNIPTSNNRRGRSGNTQNDHHQHQHQIQQQQQQQHQPHNNIPSLFDIVGKPLVSLIGLDKHRKSRWADSPTPDDTTSATPDNKTQLPSYLDLKNLEGIMKAEHIEKLTRLGITNLQELNQMTIGQLQQVGIDFVEISEVQKVQSRVESGAKNDNEDNLVNLRIAATAAAAKANEAEKNTGGAAGSSSNAAADSVITKIAGLGKTMRDKMQNAAWYRELSSNMKIQYNQELARLITELRRFHQDNSPDKNFNFINCNKEIMDHILISLGIFIDENGEVNKIESDKTEECDMNAKAEARGDFMQQLDFPNPQFDMPNSGFNFLNPPFDFRFPPPLFGGSLANLRAPLAAAASAMPPWLDGPSLLGMPPIGNFNPFNVGAGVGNFQATGRGLLDAGTPMGFNGFLNFPQQHMGGGGGGSRNFNMEGGHNRRNPNNRRHFI